jgi:RNA polymerase sigma-70 factor (ECF subfamily)
MAELTDEDIYRAWIAGDGLAGRQLITRRLDGIRRLLRTLLPEGEYEDAVQEVFFRLAQRAKRGGEIANVRAFIGGLARNVVRERLRSRVRDPDDFAERSFADICPDQPTRMALREDQRILLEALRRLPLDDQILLSLRYWERVRTRELAGILAANPSTVRTRLQRAQARLERLVRELSESPDASETTSTSLSGWARAVQTRM